MTEVAAVLEANPAAEAPFVKELIKMWRAQDTHGAWEGKSDLIFSSHISSTRRRAGRCRSWAIPDPGHDLAAGAVLQRGGAFDRTRRPA